MDGRFDKAVRDMLSLEDEAVLLTSAANLVLQEYVLSAPTMSAKHFGLFCRTFARLAPRSQDITYQAAEAALARRALSVENTQPELFDEVRQQVFRGDAGGLAALAAAIGRETGARQPLCPGFADRTRRFFARQAWHHSFTDDEIRRLRETLTEEYPNPQIRGIFAAAAAEAEQIQRQKRERDINMLNRWAFAFKSDDLLKKLSFRNTYVNLLYERLVREHEIKNIVPEEHYRRHRLIVQRQIRELRALWMPKGKKSAVNTQSTKSTKPWPEMTSSNFNRPHMLWKNMREKAFTRKRRLFCPRLTAASKTATSGCRKSLTAVTTDI